MSNDQHARAMQSNIPDFAHKRQLYKFLSEPQEFNGSTDRNPLSCLRHLDRIRKGLELRDEEILLVACTHFRGQAELWWDSVEDEVQTWSQFKKAFRKQFADSLEDRRWSELETMEQGDDETIDYVALSILELFRLLGIKDDSFRIRCFLRAIKQEIGYELEKRGVSGDWDEVIKSARQVEVAIGKYSKQGFSRSSSRVCDLSSRSSTKSSKSSKSSMKGDFDTESLGSTLAELVSGMRALKINLVDQPQSRERQEPFRCYKCGKEGHSARFCPQEDDAGKDKGHQ